MAGKRLPRNVVALGLVSLFTDLSSEMIYPLLPVFLATTLGAGPAALGLIEGVAEATASLLKLFSGAWSDRVRRRKPLVLFGYSVSTAARPLAGLASAWGHLLLVRFSDRVGKGVRSSPRDALIASSVPPADRGRAFGLQRALDHTGAVLGPLVAFLLLTGPGLSLRQVFFLSAVPGLLAVGVILFGVRDEGSPAPPHAGGTFAGGQIPPALRRYLAVVALFTLGNASDAFLILRAVDSGVPAPLVPLLWGGFHAVKAGLSTHLGILSDRWDRRKVIAGGWLVYAACYGAWAAVSGPAPTVAVFLVYGVYAAATEGAERALVADLVPAERRGTAFGWFHLVTGLAALPASVLFGAVWGVAGPAAAFGLSASLALSASLLLFPRRGGPGRG